MPLLLHEENHLHQTKNVKNGTALNPYPDRLLYQSRGYDLSQRGGGGGIAIIETFGLSISQARFAKARSSFSLTSFPVKQLLA